MASVDYTGRSVDLLIFQGTKAAGEQQVELGFGEAGEVVTGIQKVLQSFTTLFLARKGTVPSNLSLGSGFVSAMQQGRIQDESDVRNEFNLAAEDVRDVLALDAETNGLPDDEIFASAELISFALDKASQTISLKVRVTSAAGTSREVFLPVPLAIR